MTDFTPTTEQVRSHYVFDQKDRWNPERGILFDRWLAKHDAEVKAAAYREVANKLEAEYAGVINTTGMSYEDAAVWEVVTGKAHALHADANRIERGVPA